MSFALNSKANDVKKDYISESEQPKPYVVSIKRDNIMAINGSEALQVNKQNQAGFNARMSKYGQGSFMNMSPPQGNSIKQVRDVVYK